MTASSIRSKSRPITPTCRLSFSLFGQTGYLIFTKDPLDWHEDGSEYTRETTRVVAGLEWQPAEDHMVEFSVNQGMFEQTS